MQHLYIFANCGQQNLHQQETITEMLWDGTYKQYLEIDPDQWTNLNNADWIIFELNTQQEVGRATVSELRDTVALVMKKKIYFSWNDHSLSISAYQSAGHIFTQYTEFDHLTNKSYLEFYPYQWNGLQNNADNAVVIFKVNLEEFVGEVTIGELRTTTAISLMVKKRVYFSYNLGQQYSINAWQEDGQQFLFTADILLDDSNNKQYLDIDPDQFGHLDSTDWVTFSFAGQQESCSPSFACSSS
ncbi:hypothetical protein niasHT_011303 [Heterodera trifolii]|uniref:Uncharacterized protein n=1 Tax=Heterodera trifolii TaxID=157864 RepID=A0ABD2L9W2_9BILA